MKKIGYFSILSLVLIGSVIKPALACSTCMAGDPTLTLMGTEKSYVGRLRIASDWLARTEKIGISGFNQSELREDRFTLGFAYARNERLNFAIRLPVIRKHIDYVNLAEEQTTGLGDVELSAKYTLSLNEQTQHEHLFGMVVGLRMPSAGEEEINGQPLDIDVQLGTGAWVPHVGLWYGRYRFPWFFYASGVIHVASEGFQDFQAGTAVITTLLAQYAINYQVAVQLGLDTRWSQKNQFDGVNDPDSGGFLTFLAPGIVVNFGKDILANLTVQIPVMDNLNGNQEESTIIKLGFTYDF